MARRACSGSLDSSCLIAVLLGSVVSVFERIHTAVRFDLIALGNVGCGADPGRDGV